MRVLAACLVGFLSMGALSTLAACSDTSDGTGTGGAAGASAAAGSSSGGKAGSAGASSTAGTGGGSAECSFASDECNTCLFVDHCTTQVAACGNDAACGAALQTLPNCACDPAKTADECQAAFVTAGGDKAEQLANCYTLNCESACQ